MLLIGKGATVSFTIIVGQVSNGTETIMETSVAENANANASLLTLKLLRLMSLDSDWKLLDTTPLPSLERRMKTRWGLCDVEFDNF